MMVSSNNMMVVMFRFSLRVGWELLVMVLRLLCSECISWLVVLRVVLCCSISSGLMVGVSVLSNLVFLVVKGVLCFSSSMLMFLCVVISGRLYKVLVLVFWV